MGLHRDLATTKADLTTTMNSILLTFVETNKFIQ